jgi:ABC-type glycerol-3-phosphate transport system substrate-binding protein
MALAALAAVASVALAGAGPAQAADGVTTIELTSQKDVSLGEAQKLVDAATKTTADGPHVVAVTSDPGTVPTVQQIDVLLAGKSVDGIKLYRTEKEPGAARTVSSFLEGTPLPAVVSYKRNNGHLIHVVVISCLDYCRIYVREYVIM